MKQIYTGLKNQIQDYLIDNDLRKIAYYNMWNNQVARLRDGHPDQLDFKKPAVFFEFIPGPSTDVGWGVQVFDNFNVKVHVVHSFFNNVEAGTELNIDVFDVAADVHKAIQGYELKGADYGTSRFTRIETEIDHDHDNIFHWIYTYQTTWTDNSTKEPRGGFEKDPPLDADITGEKIELPMPEVTASVSSIDFGDIVVGQSGKETFTIEASNSEENVILSVSDQQFLISLNDSLYKSRIEMSPVDGELAETTVYVKFTPSGIGAVSSGLNYGIIGSNHTIDLTGEGT